MVDYKSRLYKVLLNELLEEQTQDIALLMSLLILHMMLVSDRFCLFVALDLSDIPARILTHCLYHGNSLERLGHGDHYHSVSPNSVYRISTT